jgi:hypothetical protein
MRDVITQPINVLPFLNPGRLVKISQPGIKGDWCANDSFSFCRRV